MSVSYRDYNSRNNQNQIKNTNIAAGTIIGNGGSSTYTPATNNEGLPTVDDGGFSRSVKNFPKYIHFFWYITQKL